MRGGVEATTEGFRLQDVKVAFGSVVRSARMHDLRAFGLSELHPKPETLNPK